ncbi:prepilin peptidase [Amycolatopsis benzoatilytica]|uniref:prepilin peptidase n=1 Tax=Amycolatopsis benzoatilytica TaxID=346045 RepID=UPI0003723C61|nr:prepilin peptidase [Amycolatopsis benzoatilytica]
MTESLPAATAGLLALCAVLSAAVGAAAALVLPHVGSASAKPLAWQVNAAGTAAITIALAVRHGPRAELAIYACAVAVAVPLAVLDWQEHRLPHRWSLVLAGLVGSGWLLLAIARHDWPSLLRAAAASAVVSCGFLVLALLSRGGLGAGDVTLAGALGLLLGWTGWPLVLTAVAAASVAAAIALIATPVRRLHRGRAVVPFGPYLCSGAFLALLLAGGPEHPARDATAAAQPHAVAAAVIDPGDRVREHAGRLLGQAAIARAAVPGPPTRLPPFSAPAPETDEGTP